MAGRRRHFFRVVRVKLECGHLQDIHTGSYRLSRDLASIIFQDAIRKGEWCHTCNSGMALPVEFVGVFREGGLKRGSQ